MTDQEQKAVDYAYSQIYTIPQYNELREFEKKLVFSGLCNGYQAGYKAGMNDSGKIDG